MNRWDLHQVPLKFQLSDWTILSITLKLQCRSVDLMDESPLQALPSPPVEELMDGSQGFMIRALPVTGKIPIFSQSEGYLCYVPLQYQHCYIDLTLSFSDYRNKFSSKTRSTINRKIKKYAEHCGGTIPWRTYKEPGQMRDFFRLARTVSVLTYQERLLDAGIPGTEDFIQQAESLAAKNLVRAYILFDGERPVSYLYCPVKKGVLIYTYLGYDPNYIKMSVGTVLQWLALEQIFGEGCFRAFDFTEGQSDYKQLFATHQLRCVNVLLVKDFLRNRTLIHSHIFMNRFSGWFGAKLDQLGLKARIKRLLRFAW